MSTILDNTGMSFTLRNQLFETWWSQSANGGQNFE